MIVQLSASPAAVICDGIITEAHQLMDLVFGHLFDNGNQPEAAGCFPFDELMTAWDEQPWTTARQICCRARGEHSRELGRAVR